MAVSYEQKNKVILDHILNFRDIAPPTIDGSHRHSTQPGRIYRSARPDGASQHDQETLRGVCGVRTNLDLRSQTELREAIKACRPLGASLNSIDDRLTIPGIERIHLDFNGRTFSSALFSRLSYLHQIIFIILYLLAFRRLALSILARHVLAPRGLIGLAEDSLMYCRKEIKSIFDLLADADKYPILVHCTQGKDRTGLVVLLVQMLMGADKSAIEADYLASQDGLAAERDERVREIVAIGLPESFADCEPTWSTSVMRLIQSEHGGIEDYLIGCGVSLEQQFEIRRLLAST